MEYVSRAFGPVRGRVFVIIITVAFLFGIGFSVRAVIPNLLDEREICPGVRVGGIDVGGIHVDEARQRIAQHIAALASEPVILRLEGQTWRVRPSDIGFFVDIEEVLGRAYAIGRQGWIIARLSERADVRSRGMDISWDVSYDEEKIRDLAFMLREAVAVEPRDARLVITPEDEVIIEQSSEGRQVRTDVLASALKIASTSLLHRSIDIPVAPLSPKVSTSQVEAMGIRRKISQYTTKFDPKNTNRSTNIVLGAAILDGVTLAPGEVLSFNETVGPRTPDRGFLEADIIVNSELVPGIGGGICQVSTTLYNAAVLANLQPVSRVNHSLPSTYVPLGRDATVSYGSIDLKIRNTSAHHVMFKASVDKDVLTFKVYGDMPPGVSVSIETEIIETIPQGVVEKLDPASPVGARVVVEKGAPGYRVDMWRITSVEGNEVGRELLSRDRYKPRHSVVKVGSGPAPTSPVR